MKETITKDTRRPGESQLDFLWSNYGNRPVASDTKNPDAIPSMGLLNRLLQLLKEEAVGSVVREGSFVVIRSVDGVEMGRFDIKELQGVYSVVDFGHRVVTEDDIEAGCKYDLYTPVYYITLDNGQTFWVPSEAYFGGETGGIKTTVQDKRIISYLKFDPNSSIAFKDEEGLFGEIRLDSEGATIRFDMVSMQTYLSITPKENTIYFIKNRPYFYFNGFRIGTESESDVTQLIKEAKEEIYERLKAEHERAFKSEATLEVMVRSNHHAIEKLHHILHKITDDLQSGDYPKYTYFEYNGELRKTLVLSPNATISGESEKGGSQLLMVKDYDGVEVPVVEVGGQKAALVLNTCEERVKVEVVEDGKRVQHSVATLDDLLAFAEKVKNDTLIELIQNGVSMALSRDLTVNDTLMLNKSPQELDFNEKIVTIAPEESVWGVAIMDDGDYSIKNGEIKCGGSAIAGLGVFSEANVVVENLTIKEANYPLYMSYPGATMTVKSGTFASLEDNSPAVYVQDGGLVVIEGGEFGKSDVENEYLLNLKDSIRAGKDPREFLLVKGGKFWNFNPADNTAEGPGTNFVAEGYHVEVEGNAYIVVRNTQVPTDTTNLTSRAGIYDIVDDITNSGIVFGAFAAGEYTYINRGHTVYSPNTNSQILVRSNMTLNIKGEGTWKNDKGYGIWTSTNENATVNIYGGEFIGAMHAVYSEKGTINIYGGEFKVSNPEVEGASAMLINCRDANYQAGTAKINIYGGRFYKFNPADNTAEGEHTSFVAEGYTVKQDGDWYEVIPVTD